MSDPEKAALHAYVERLNEELVSAMTAMAKMRADASEQIDLNGPSVAFYCGAHMAIQAAQRLCDRALLLAAEAAVKIGAAGHE